MLQYHIENTEEILYKTVTLSDFISKRHYLSPLRNPEARNGVQCDGRKFHYSQDTILVYVQLGNSWKPVKIKVIVHFLTIFV